MTDPNVNNLALAYPRYSRDAFPPYRFVPGRHPHPVASPQGHSYLPPGESPPPARCVAPEAWRTSAEYLYGCDLYNHGYWWEAHEAWEALWHAVPNPSPQRRYLQGLIQVSAGQLQTFLGKAAGVRRLRASSREHLEAAAGVAGERFMGLLLWAWMDEVDAYWETVLATDPPAHRVDAFPYLRLESP